MIGTPLKMKKMYSSGALTALQKSAEAKQKWPLLNLVRQILKSNNYNYKLDIRTVYTVFISHKCEFISCI